MNPPRNPRLAASPHRSGAQSHRAPAVPGRRRAGRRKTFALIRGWALLCLAAEIAWLGGVAGTSGSAPAPAAPLDLDRLWLHQGDPLRGTLRTETFELQTAYGRLLLPAERVLDLQLAGGVYQIDTLTAVNSNRFSGFLLNPVLRFQPTTGRQVTLRREGVSRLLLRGRPLPDQAEPDFLFLLRNGDTLSGRLADRPFHLVNPSLDVRIQTREIQSVRFDPAQPLFASVRATDGREHKGSWPDEDLELTLDLGPTLAVHPSRMAAIQRFTPLFAPTVTGGSATATGRGGPGEPRPGMVWIPPGEFLMGSPVEELDRDLDEGPQTRVRITRGFWMGLCEVTQAEYQGLMGENPSLFLGDTRRPVERVRHREAMEYCRRLTRLQDANGELPEGYAYRLPTEAEWEHACRAGTTTRFSHGDDPQGHTLEAYAWFSANSGSSPQPVGTRQPNPWGLHDLHGNVLEWCLDGAGAALPGGEVVDYVAPPDGILRVARGGSWLYGAKACRSANRDSYGEANRGSDLGFRVVLARADP